MTDEKPKTGRKTTGRVAASAEGTSAGGSAGEVNEPVSVASQPSPASLPDAAASAPAQPSPAPAASVPAAASPDAYQYATEQVPVDVGPRKVRLALSRVDPLSVMKLSLLLSFALGIIMVVATAVFWHVLDGMHVFTKINDMIVDVTGEGSTVNILDYLEFSKVMSYVTLIAIVDLFILTALATLGAFLYNVTASLVGGVYVTLIDE